LVIGVKTHYWSPDKGENYGDVLGLVVLRALGIKPEPPVAGEPCLFAVGAILGAHHYRSACASSVVVWGSGIDNRSDSEAPLDFRAVRGPIARDTFRLPADTPIGGGGIKWVKS
jgi:hypothetical protein